MGITIVRSVADIRVGTTWQDYFSSFSAGDVLRDDDGFYNPVSELIDLPAGDYLVHASVQGRDADFGASVAIEHVIAYDLNASPGIVNTRWGQRHATGTATPKLAASGVVTLASAGIPLVGVRHSDSAARYVNLELQIQTL